MDKSLNPFGSQFIFSKMGTVISTTTLHSPQDCLGKRHAKRHVEAIGKILYKSQFSYFTAQNCCLECDFALIIPSTRRWGGVVNRPMEWEVERELASNLPMGRGPKHWPGNRKSMLQRAQIKSSISKQLSWIRGNLEYSFFDIMVMKISPYFLKEELNCL